MSSNKLFKKNIYQLISTLLFILLIVIFSFCLIDVGNPESVKDGYKSSPIGDTNSEDDELLYAGICKFSENLCAEVLSFDLSIDNFEKDCSIKFEGIFSKETQCSIVNPLVGKWCEISETTDQDITYKFNFEYSSSYTQEEAEKNCYCTLGGSFCSKIDDEKTASCTLANFNVYSCE